jgi:Mg-chelatase subunit ChlD
MKIAVSLWLSLLAVCCLLFASCASAPEKGSGAASLEPQAKPAPSPAQPGGDGGTETAPAKEAEMEKRAKTAEEPAPDSGLRSAETTAKKDDEGPGWAEEPGSPEGKGFGGVGKTEGSPLRGERGAPRSAAPAASGLQAGFADDNKQFNYFVNFLGKYAGQVPSFPIPIQERIVIKVTDQAGKPLANARVAISGGGKPLAEGVTYADGTFLFFPSEHDASLTRYTGTITALKAKKEIVLERAGKRQVEARFQAPRPAYASVPLDILFVMDTTGSMQEEIERLKATIEIINLNLSSLSSRPTVRFGMVLYRDREDEYVTSVVPMTSDLAEFQKRLAGVNADGGGDDPEDLQGALKDAMKEVSWDPSGIRMAFIVTDAPPHLDYPDEPYTYVDAAHEARTKGIKIFSVGTGGLDLAGELVLRQLSQYTYAKYIFLTYGEKGESEGGAPGSVSHHTGSNFQTDKLEAIIMRFAKEELSYLTDQPITEEGDYFQATRTSGEEKSETLAKLFDMAISQIVDYAAIRIPEGTPTAALPLVPQGQAERLTAEYFGEQLVQSLARSRAFSAVERKDLQAVMKELELQMSGISDEANAARLGKVIGAQMLLTSAMYDRDANYEVFLKLLRVETGEILSVTKLVVDKKLGL